ALKILEIDANDIGIKGTEYLADAIKENMVIKFYLFMLLKSEL
ncbi:unnamed protein product, partial [Rotaria sp. Silwood1]